MRKKLVFLLFSAFLVFAGLFSCEEYILPKNVEVEGTLDFPLRIGTSNWGVAVARALEKAIAENANSDDTDLDFDVKVYDVNYGQDEQAFLAYIYSEMTNPLNPSDYLKDVAEFLYKKDSDLKYEIKSPEEFDVSKLRDLSLDLEPIPIPATAPIPWDTPLPAANPLSLTIPASTLPIPTKKLNAGFLHALIKEGTIALTVTLNGNTINIASNTVSIGQNTIAGYNGLSCSLGPLENQHLNHNDIKISGTVTLNIAAGTVIPSGADVQLTLELMIGKLKEVDWDFTKIQGDLNHQIGNITLDDVAKYVNYIAYDAYDGTVEGEPTTGVGIQFNFEKMVNGFEMALGCEALGLSENFTNSDFKTIEKGKHIVFGNKNAGTMWLAGNEPVSPLPPPFEDGLIDKLEFKVELRPKGGGDVAHMDFGDDGIAPEEIKIDGTARFFQNWTEAEINMSTVIKAQPNLDDVFEGQIPEEKDDPIDLSILGDYIPGFTFDRESIQAKIFLGGPHEAIENQDLEVSFTAEYTAGGEDISEPVYHGDLILDKILASIGENDLDAQGSYKRGELPAGGNEFNFAGVLNHQPNNLVFKYRVNLPMTLTVTSDMFQSEIDGSGEEMITINSNITATIMILLHLKLNGPGAIAFPDMFEDMGDLFGRDEPGVLLENVNVRYVKVTLDFMDLFFTGGQLFMEKFDDTEPNYKDKMLFPNGIGLNGKRITVNIDNDTLKTMETNLIYPDVKIFFAQEGTIRVPKKLGVAVIKFEVHGSTNVGEFFE